MSFFRWLAVGAPAIYFGSYYLGRWLRRRIILKTTGLADLPRLGQARPAGQKIKGVAVVCGGSIGGLLTARVCHDHFEKVVIVEPEAWLASEDGRNPQAWKQTHHRSRVMQYYSLTSLLPFAYTVCKKLFPNLKEECEASDLHVLPADFHGSMWGLPTHPPYEEYGDNFPKTFYGSRQSTETLIRRLLIDQKSYPNIQWVVGTATGVIADPEDTSRLKKVVVRTGSTSVELEAVLIIDCTGPAEAGLKWLQREGYGFADSYKGTLPLDRLSVAYNQNIQYSTCIFTLTPELARRLPTINQWDSEGVLLALYTDSRVDRKCVTGLRIEDNRLILCCGVWSPSDEMPKTLPEIKEFCRSMILSKPIPEWWMQMLDMLDEVQDTVECHIARCPPSTCLRFHEAANLPSNYIAIGDSVMRVNPVFGQGIMKATLGVISMNNILHDVAASSKAGVHVSALPSTFAKDFFATQWSKIGPIWQSTRVYDYGWDSTIPIPGETLAYGSWLRWFQRNILTLSQTDREACSAFWHTMMALSPPIDMFHPRILAKILWHVLRHGPA
ncbi:hypothetical protein BV22DRAFT_1090482 [Leucogyrophana mollusca]|uniref:Uncharacterized protein n=1 Tax=Leucogyrophana mollusca TaxID=85980 RepID=A0ACB8BGG6_9AGAM|nr:hypothetical protein BV22DRAFT_1090482 [Leucogyrophana mollusca]